MTLLLFGIVIQVTAVSDKEGRGLCNKNYFKIAEANFVRNNTKSDTKQESNHNRKIHYI